MVSLLLDHGSRWSLSFQSLDDNVLIGLHWNEKDIPTHEVTVSKAELLEAMRVIGVVQ
jgi:hypothetical protein